MSDCTCHPERAPKPCPKRYQYSECILAAEVERLRAELAAERERCAHWKKEADNLIVALRRGVGTIERKKKKP